MSTQQKKAWCLLALSALALVTFGGLWLSLGVRLTELIYPSFTVSLALALVLVARTRAVDKAPSDERDRFIALRASLIGAVTSLGLLLAASTAVSLVWPYPHQRAVDSDLLPHFVLVAMWH